MDSIDAAQESDHPPKALSSSVDENRRGPHGLVRRLVPALRLLLWSASIIYFALVVLIAVAFAFHGEKSASLALLLYLPPQVWLLPGLILSPLCLLLARRAFFFHLGAYLVAVLVLMGFRWSPGRSISPSPGNLKVVINNRGQDNRQSLTPFLAWENPDLVLLQEDGRAAAFKKVYPDRFIDSLGEFTIISKFPLGRSGQLVPSRGGSPYAAWWEVEFKGRRIMVYNVHLPTPRRELRSSRGGILLHRLTGRRQPAYDALQASWEGRVELAREFAALIDREQQPCIVAGDFNMPHSGYVYRVFSGHLQDAFGQAGRGFGYTLPGTTRNPLSLFGPWLRLDYIFCSSDFQIASARTEPTRKSQHRAVSAALVLRSSQNSHGEP